MTNITEINSENYWDRRFKEDWQINAGPKQSRFFAQIALENLPQWLITAMRREALSIADWGCAQGDGTNVWLNYLLPSQITGVDFSSIAIEQASEQYPALRFINEDWVSSNLTENGKSFDLIFSSNTLEHFHNPFEVLDKICERSKLGIVLALPFNEADRISEHFYSFVKENLPLVLKNGFRLVWSRVIDCQKMADTSWLGEQIILFYAQPNWIDSLGLTLADIEISSSTVFVEDSEKYQLLEKQHVSQLLEQEHAYKLLEQQHINVTALNQEENLRLNSEISKLELEIKNTINLAQQEKSAMSDLLNNSIEENSRIKALLNASNQEKESLQNAVHSKEAKILLDENQIKSHRQNEIELEKKLAISMDDNSHYEKLLVEKDNQLNYLIRQDAMLRQSSSWRITRPLRFTKLFFQNPKKATYDLAKFVFWRCPLPVREALHGPRHKFIRFSRQIPNAITVEKTVQQAQDLDWVQFNEQVLSKRHEYKGVFVQELVIDWNVPLFQRPQHIAAAFGRLGYLVIYKTDNWAGDDVNGFREVVKNVWISNSPDVDKINNVVRSLYSTAYANTPDLILKNGKRGVLVYEYIDHIDPQISGDDGNIKRLLALKDFAFGGGADFVVASAKKLESEAISEVGNDCVVLAQNGVDTRHYRDKKHLATVLPENLTVFRKKYSKIVGYFGALAPWLWYEVVNELVQSRQDIGFVFIGPDYYGGADKLIKNADNLLYLGAIDYKVLPAYALNFDICFIPFAPSEIAKTTSPLKLFEYFALEKPVVVTSDMQECVAFDEVFRGDSVESLSSAIDEAFLVKDNVDFKLRLATLADENDWDQRARAMEVVFKQIGNEK
ncbi:methyltransferase [Undibacterium sp. Ji67W]|uniref:methyltransferase n=1 Tax=Undibacterium sp. Ji67W TaxID=3413042 RepID=UPI003BEF6B82